MNTVQETWATFCEKQLLQTNTSQKKKWNQFSLRPTLDLLDQEYPGLKENFLAQPVGKGGSIVVVVISSSWGKGPLPEQQKCWGWQGALGSGARPRSLRAAVKHNQEPRPVHVTDSPACPSISPEHCRDFGNAMGSMQMLPKKKKKEWEGS